LNSENIKKKINALFRELQDETQASDTELEELKKILDLADVLEYSD